MKKTMRCRVAGLLTAAVLLTPVPRHAAAEADPAEEPPVDTGVPVAVATQPGYTVRNPFAEPVLHQKGMPHDPAQDIVFDGSVRQLPSSMGSLRGRTLPRIRVRGIMEVEGRIAACAEVEDIGTVVLQANERILLSGRKPGRENAGRWFLVRVIEKTGMTIELDDGTLVQGKFF
jgi:hypothetical protein